jgi:hypothetical protein
LSASSRAPMWPASMPGQAGVPLSRPAPTMGPYREGRHTDHAQLSSPRALMISARAADP